jgi:hypothetical protein
METSVLFFELGYDKYATSKSFILAYLVHISLHEDITLT